MTRDLARKFLGELTSGAICWLPNKHGGAIYIPPNKRDLLRSADRRLNLPGGQFG